MTPTVICAWCRKTITAGGEEISHGMCLDCFVKQQAEVFNQPITKGNQ